MKCALLSVFESSSTDPFTAGVLWLGKSRLSLVNIDCGGGGGRFRIDLPGVGIVTADEDAGLEVLAIVAVGTNIDEDRDNRVLCYSLLGFCL